MIPRTAQYSGWTRNKETKEGKLSDETMILNQAEGREASTKTNSQWRQKPDGQRWEVTSGLVDRSDVERSEGRGGIFRETEGAAGSWSKHGEVCKVHCFGKSLNPEFTTQASYAEQTKAEATRAGGEERCDCPLVTPSRDSADGLGRRPGLHGRRLKKSENRRLRRRKSWCNYEITRLQLFEVWMSWGTRTGSS